MPDHPMRRATDGTMAWPDQMMTPVDRVEQALINVMRARGHVDAAVQELHDAVRRLQEAATGGHR